MIRPGDSAELSISARVIERLPQAIADIFSRCLGAEPTDPHSLRVRVGDYERALIDKARTHEFLDLELGRRLARRAEALLQEMSHSTDPAQRQLIQASIEYFLLDDDADSDSLSIIGFDDDELVIRTVEEVLGKHDVDIND